MQRFPTKLVAVALVLLLQGPALLLQEIAWASMIVRYASQDGLTRGVSKTFDGKHPCRLCCKAEALRQAEKERPDLPVDPTLKSRLQWTEMPGFEEIRWIPAAPQPADIQTFSDPLRKAGVEKNGPPPPPPKLFRC